MGHYYPAIRQRLIQLKLHGIYMLFLIKFWIQNTFKTYSSLFVGLSFQIFLIQITKNFCFTFRHSENSSLAQNQNNNKRKKLTEKVKPELYLIIPKHKISTSKIENIINFEKRLWKKYMKTKLNIVACNILTLNFHQLWNKKFLP